jgi:putative ABC transport system permease protein
VTRLLHRASLRFYLRHPWQLAIAIVGIGLGVGVFVGVQLANDSAARAFDVAATLVRGAATHRLVPLGDALDEGLFRELVLERGITTAAPVVEAYVAFAGRPGLRAPLLGVDPLKERGIRGFSTFGPGGNGAFARLLTEPATVLVPEGLAEALGVITGDTLQLVIAGREVGVTVIGTMAAADDVAAEPPLLCDIATAQELFGLEGKLSRIDLRLTAGEAKSLAAAPLPGTVLITAGSEDRTFTELTTAFRTNLTALGLLALVVGTFLIYGTMSFAILQRRHTLGVLRALGTTQNEIVGSVLVEALGVGIAATLLGLGLGHWLALGLVEQVLRTIGDLNFRAAVVAVAPSPWIYAQGVGLGIGATLVAAAKPAIEAARTTPAIVLRRASLERQARREAHWGAIAAMPVAVIGGMLLTLGPSTLVVAFAGLFAILGACALATPTATMVVMRIIGSLLGTRAGLPAALAVRGVSASLSRTGVATTALAVAIATVNGIGLMITSFRTSLGDWLETTLTADLYVTFDDATALTLDGLLGRIQQIDGVSGTSVTRAVVLPTDLGEIALRAYQPGTRGWGVQIVQGEPATAIESVAAGDGVLASERLMLARSLRIGDEIALPTPSRTERLPIVGAFRDFNTGNYGVVIGLERYRRDWGDDGISGLGVDVGEGVEESVVESAVRTTLEGVAGARVRSSAGIERLSLEVFDRTFKITEVLRVLAAIVAFLGVLSALLAIEMERAREMGVLRALGFAPRQLQTLLLVQTGLLGLAAGLIAMPIGSVLAGLLVHVINRRAFGWSMDLAIAPGGLAFGVALAVAAALLAGAYPAWRASRGDLAVALREE